jgi:hypothetical protein
MVDSLRLMIFEWRKVSDGWGFGFVKDFASETLQVRPARPFESGSVRDLPKRAAPLNDDSVDVSGT